MHRLLIGEIALHPLAQHLANEPRNALALFGYMNPRPSGGFIFQREVTFSLQFLKITNRVYPACRSKRNPDPHPCLLPAGQGNPASPGLTPPLPEERGMSNPWAGVRSRAVYTPRLPPSVPCEKPPAW